MPADRLLHARLGHSAKVSGLSDLEFRVWTTYILAADDFGVMRADAVAFQAAHDGLSKRQAKAIQRAIERLVKVGLVAAFTHQGSRYLFQIDWQDFQRVRYPLRTMHPLPAAAEVSPKTRHLWSVHPGGAKVPALTKSSGPIAVRLPETSGATAPEAPGAQSGPGASPGGFPKSPRKAPERDPEDSGTCAGTLPSHARACQTANGLRPMAIKRVGVRGRENRRPGLRRGQRRSSSGTVRRCIRGTAGWRMRRRGRSRKRTRTQPSGFARRGTTPCWSSSWSGS